MVKCACRVSGLAIGCPIAVKNAPLFDIQSDVSGIVVGQFRFTLRFNKNPIMSFSRCVVLIRFDSSDVVV